MSVEQYGAVLVRLDNLERQVRWRRIERVLTLALVAWLLAAGPPSRSLRDRWDSLRTFNPGLALRAALTWTSAEARDLVTIRPAIDPKTVLEDEREVLRISATEAAPHGQVPSASVSRTTPPSARHLPLAKSADGTTAPAAVTAAALQRASTDFGLTSTSQAAAVSASKTQPDLGASVREAERTLTRVTENGPRLAAAVPMLPSLAGSGNSLTSLIPAALPGIVSNPATATEHQPAVAASSSDSTATGSPAPAVTLKALGYAQSSDGAQAILTDGLTLYVVNEGEEFAAGRFRVVAIRPEDLEVEDLFTNAILELTFGH